MSTNVSDTAKDLLDQTQERQGLSSNNFNELQNSLQNAQESSMYQDAWSKQREEIENSHQNKLTELMEQKQRYLNQFATDVTDDKRTLAGLFEKKDKLNTDITDLDTDFQTALDNRDDNAKYLAGVLNQIGGPSLVTLFLSPDVKLPSEVNEEALKETFKEKAEEFTLSNDEEYLRRRDVLVAQQEGINKQIDAFGDKFGDIIETERRFDHQIAAQYKQYQRDITQLDKRYGDRENLEQYQYLSNEVDKRVADPRQQVLYKQRLANAVQHADSPSDLQDIAERAMPELGFDSTDVKSTDNMKTAIFDVSVDKSGQLQMRERNPKNPSTITIRDNTLDFANIAEGTRVVLRIDKEVKQHLDGDKLRTLNDDHILLDYGSPGREKTILQTERRTAMVGSRPVHSRVASRDKQGHVITKRVTDTSYDKYANPADVIDGSTLSGQNLTMLEGRSAEASNREMEKHAYFVNSMKDSIDRSNDRLKNTQESQAGLEKAIDKSKELVGNSTQTSLKFSELHKASGDALAQMAEAVKNGPDTRSTGLASLGGFAHNAPGGTDQDLAVLRP